MAELADAADSKSADRKVVGVRPPLPAPSIFNKNNCLRSIKPLGSRGFFVTEDRHNPYTLFVIFRKSVEVSAHVRTSHDSRRQGAHLQTYE